MERLPNRYPKISQSHKVPLYKGLSLFYPKLLKNSVILAKNSPRILDNTNDIKQDIKNL